MNPHKQMGRVLAKARAENDRINLDALIAAVEVGAIGPYHSPGAFKALGFSQMSRASSAYHGSLDAAKALHDALLPGMFFDIATSADGLSFYAHVSTPSEFQQVYMASAKTPARAWLLAILKAYRATMEESK